MISSGIHSRQAKNGHVEGVLGVATIPLSGRLAQRSNGNPQTWALQLHYQRPLICEALDSTQIDDPIVVSVWQYAYRFRF